LSEALLAGVTLLGANLSDSILTSAHFSGAELFGATLSRADLSDAELLNANLNSSILTNANLRGANLSLASFCYSDIRGANLESAILHSTVLGDTDLSGATGLDSCNHLGPSIVDHRTLARSGTLPLTFLRGCGIPDTLIQYTPSLFNDPLQFYSCFIRYSTKDQEFAERFHADLQNKEVRCWFAPEDIAGGKKLHEQIDQAIRIHDRLLLILSHHSMNSEWVKTEIAKARQREVQQDRRVLFPIRLVDFEEIRKWKNFDADTGKDSAQEIREYFIPDFSNWKNHDAYKCSFDRLIKDLKAPLDDKGREGFQE
jgi:uncharacterized protein YjbI with pentapeptide repeats